MAPGRRRGRVWPSFVTYRAAVQWGGGGGGLREAFASFAWGRPGRPSARATSAGVGYPEWIVWGSAGDALQGHSQGPPTAICHQPPPTTNRRQPPTATHCSIPFLWSCVLPMSPPWSRERPDRSFLSALQTLFSFSPSGQSCSKGRACRGAIHSTNTPWALPCTVLSRSWSILRDFIAAGSGRAGGRRHCGGVAVLLTLRHRRCVAGHRLRPGPRQQRRGMRCSSDAVESGALRGRMGEDGLGEGSRHWGHRCTAPIITVFIPGTPLQTTPPTEACMIHSKPHQGCRVQDPGTRGYRRWKTADFSHSAGTAPGAPPVCGIHRDAQRLGGGGGCRRKRLGFTRAAGLGPREA